MKNIFILLLSAFISMQLTAQTVIRKESRTMDSQEMANIEVKDSTGLVYPMAIWQKLVGSGKYGMKIQADRKTALIYPLSAEEVNKRFDRLPKPKESIFFRTGETIASFKERDIKGNKFNLDELRGKVVVLNFWFINCPPCRKEMPELNELVEAYKNNQDVVFIAVSLDESWEIKEFLKTNPFNYHIIDRGRYIADKYGIHLYPTHVILNKQGKVLFHTSGLATNTVHWIRKSIEAGLNDTVPQ